MKLHDTIARLRAGKKDDEGFTLIELLVVVVIIGVLVAIAVPVYLNYRQGAADKSAQSDVRGAISAIEQFYTENGNQFPADTTVDNKDGTVPSKALATGSKQMITVSDKTQLGFANGTGAKAGTYRICATSTGGSGKWYLYDSEKGGSVQALTTTLTLATCA
ncbi:type IV pilus assembly protein PilA [Actinoplanes philippinensis]|uniref:Type IV pilus assembly protein PilA n=2 Tax=Actinoplanes philippinensis TaxID=35752 RepID=A0A1I2N766_9ACTN|nr:prepilin-type N-terminal cleavage/methylation domain-containing protein [Actinoplanes philippinensis]SFF99795.1 type IV pilus assembly protein PilA [Actinoplanes philippinensis]